MLHRYAILVAVSTAVLILAGGMVTSTGSGLAVPDHDVIDSFYVVGGIVLVTARPRAMLDPVRSGVQA
jgi:hypothetical protein